MSEININFFSEEKPETYYFWGFILGDGSLITHKQGHRYLSISLKETDRSVLERFCQWLNLSQQKIKRGTNNYQTNYVRLEVYGNLFKQDFTKYGLVSNKTYQPIVPQLDGELVKPFILGLIDADGSVAWKKPLTNNKHPHRKVQYEHSIQLVGHPLIMDWVIGQLRLLGFRGQINHQLVKNKWKRIRIQRKLDIIELAQILNLTKYYHLCLERKWKDLYFNNMKGGAGV